MIERGSILLSFLLAGRLVNHGLVNDSSIVTSPDTVDVDVLGSDQVVLAVTSDLVVNFFLDHAELDDTIVFVAVTLLTFRVRVGVGAI